MENFFKEGFLTCGILLFYFSMMTLWSKSLSKRVSNKTRVGFLGREVIIFILLGGFLFMNYRKK